MSFANLLRKLLPTKATLLPLQSSLPQDVPGESSEALLGTTASNVVSLPVAEQSFNIPAELPTGHPLSEHQALSEMRPVGFKGLKDAPELGAFFAQPFFNFGRYHGSRHRSSEALTAGLNDLVSGLQNLLSDLIERRQVLDNSIQLEILGVETVSELLAKQLRLRSEQVKGEVANLRDQIELADQRKGWVLAALNQYQLGFDRGVREAVSFELLKI